MQFRIDAALTTGLSALALLSGCGGGGGGSGATPPPSPPANRAPTLQALSLTTSEDTATSGQLSATDPDGNPITFSLTGTAQHGTATVTASGAVNYTPASNYSGADTIGVTVSDNAGAQTAGTINVVVSPVNDAPTLTTTQFATDEDTAVGGQLTGVDVESSAFTFELVTAAQHGTLTLSPSGAYTYSPDSNYAGTDQFQIRLAETATISPQYTVNVLVRPANDAPVATSDTLQVPAADGQPVTLPVAVNDIDIEGDALTPVVVTQPRGGTVVVDATTRALRFEPANGYVGPISFTYRMNDGSAQSNIATVNAYIGDPESVVFLSDYTTPGVLELHLFDGLEVRRVSDDLPAGRRISTFSVSSDSRMLAYVLDADDAERVYVKPLDGSAPAALRYTSPAKTVPSERRLTASLNANGTHLLLRDGWTGALKNSFVVNASTGVARRVGESMPGVVDTRIVLFHPYEPDLILLQGQTSGSGPNDLINRATTAFTANAADPRTLTQIGRTYTAGQCGGGEGIYVGNDGRYIYHGEFLCAAGVINLIAYDRQTMSEAYVVRQAVAPDRGLNGVVAPVFAFDRMCFAFYLPTTTTHDGPSRFYSLDTANPASAIVVSPSHDRTMQCTMAGDNRTVIYRLNTPGLVLQQVYAVDAVSPGTPRLLVPGAEAASEQGAWQVGFDSPRIAILYYDHDGVGGMAAGQVGRYYSLSALNSLDAFLFSDTYVQPSVGAGSNAASEDGAFLLYARPRGAISALELMSTHGLNLSIPLSRDSETLGVTSMRWLRRGSARIN